MNIRKFHITGLFLCLCLCLPLQAQVLDPSIDRADEPFCYFSKPTDVIGVMDGKEGTLVTPEGYFYTGSGELMFFTGNPPVAVNQRVKTLLKGYLPVIEYNFDREGIHYSLEAFAQTLDGNPESPLINFIRVKIKNTDTKTRLAYFTTGVRYQNDENTDWGVGDNRFGRPWKAKKLGEFEQAGDTFNVHSEYSFTDDAFLKDGRLMYTFPKENMTEKVMTLKTGYNEPGYNSAAKILILPTTPVGIVHYKFFLEPGKEASLDFKAPYVAIDKNDPVVQQMIKASYDEYLDRTVKFWDSILSRGMEITLPEEKVNNTFKVNLFYDLIARNKHGQDYVQNVNEFNYDQFWIRDAASILRMYDISGYHDLARQVLDFFPRWQDSTGNFISHAGQLDAWGQAMWAYGEHYLITGDKAFAEKVYPSVQKAFLWLKKTLEQDSLHLFPVATPGDNEDITGRVTGHNFLALAGLKNVIVLANALGRTEDAKTYQAEYDTYFSNLMKRLKEVTSKTDGYITPGLDKLGGNDWGNMLTLYPEIILDPFDPMVTKTLEVTRSKYQEGIMTYAQGRYLHHYLTMNNTQSELIRGEQEKALQEFYAVLMHTGSTHTGFEFSIFPWGNRDFMMNLTPHGWFSAEFRTLLRNMMVREEKSDLHLFSALSPEWLKEGDKIAVHKAPTNFGMVNMDLSVRNGGADLKLDNKFTSNPSKLILHLPYFMAVKSVRADGKTVAVSNNSAFLPVNTKAVAIEWAKQKNYPEMSYNKAVEDYKKEYREKYQESLTK
ncbi:MAG: hypothetical protein HF309_12395 [Ignavibacteria bacterium]|jgi:hypothetical protein|nr:hypothetical protein [Ignavibacteria bacterium]